MTTQVAIPPSIDPDLARAHVLAVMHAVAADPDEEFADAFYEPAEAGDLAALGEPPLPPPLHEIWHVSDGMRCGSVWVYGSLSASEPGRGYATMLSEGLERWQGIGEIGSGPVFMDRADGSIWFNGGTDPSELWERQEEAPQRLIAPDIWTFVVCHGMGAWYPGDLNDDWIYFLRQRGLLYGESHAEQPGGEV